MSYVPPPPGTLKVLRSSPGNPMQWQALLRLPTGWVYFHAGTAREALRKAQDFKDNFDWGSVKP